MMTSAPTYRWRVGEIEITRVLEFEAALFEPAVIHSDVAPEIIERHRSWLEPRLMNPAGGLIVFAFHSTVIKTPHATILVDTSSGNDKERPQKPRYHRKNWPYLANLAAAGFAPEDINYVLCTHRHADHVGWNTRLLDGRWVPDVPQCSLSVFRGKNGSTGNTPNCAPDTLPIRCAGWFAASFVGGAGAAALASASALHDLPEASRQSGAHACVFPQPIRGSVTQGPPCLGLWL